MSIVSLSSRGSLTVPKRLGEKWGLKSSKKQLVSVEETAEGLLVRLVITTPVRSFKADTLSEWIVENENTVKNLNLWKH